MKLRLLCVGKLSETYWRQAAEEFAARLNRYLPLNEIELKEQKAGRKADPRYLCECEGERILEKIPASSYVVALDERGEALTSEQLAGRLERHMVQGTAELVFIIGGAYGLSPAVKARADQTLSLSSLTFTHQMARLFLLEQLYRAMTIVRHEPYHNR